VRTRARKHVVDQPVGDRHRIAVSGRRREHEVPHARVDELAQLGLDLFGGSRDGHVLEHRVEVLRVRHAEHPRSFGARRIGIPVDVDEHERVPPEVERSRPTRAAWSRMVLTDAA